MRSRGGRAPLLYALLVFALAMGVLWFTSAWVRSYYADHARTNAEQRLAPYSAALNGVVNSRLALVAGLDQFIKSQLDEGLTRASFDDYAQGLYDFTTGIRAIEAAPDGVIRYIYPLKGNEAAQNIDLLNDSRAQVRTDARRALSVSGTVVGGPYALVQGGEGIVTRSAIRRPDGTVWGLSTVVIDVEGIMKEAGFAGRTGGLSIAVRNAGGEVFWGDASVFDHNPVLSTIYLPEGQWDVAAEPMDGWADASSAGQTVLWATGIAVAFLLALINYLMASYQLRLRRDVDGRTRQIRQMNEVLQDDVRAMAAAEETLLTSERRFRLLFEEAPVPIVIVIDAKFSMANRALIETFGFTEDDELVGHPFADFLEPESAEIVFGHMAERAAGIAGPRRYEVKARTPQGDGVPVELNAVVFEHDGVQNTLVIVTDLRPSREAERILRESESTYRALFEDSPTPLFEEDFSGTKRYLDDLGVPADDLENYLVGHPQTVSDAAAGMSVIRVNRAAVEALGAASPEDLLGSLGEFVTEETRSLYIGEMCALARGQRRFAGSSEVVGVDGRRMRVTLSWAVPMGGESTYERCFVSMVDLTAEHAMREKLVEFRDNLQQLVDERTRELSEANEQLVDATRAKDEFLAAMSHELRTPLNSVIGFSGIMLQGLAGEVSEEQHRQLDMINRSGRHLLGLINQVLDLSKIAAGQTNITVSEFDVTELTKGLHEEAAQLAESKGIETRCSVELEDPQMRSDSQRVSQILLNLLSNAIKFTMEGTVELSVRERGDDVCFEVSDSGPGIPLAERERVFEPFYQVATDVANKPEGTGLGLAISRDLAGLLGGTLEFVDKDSRGTSALLCIPRYLSKDLLAE